VRAAVTDRLRRPFCFTRLLTEEHQRRIPKKREHNYSRGRPYGRLASALPKPPPGEGGWERVAAWRADPMRAPGNQCARNGGRNGGRSILCLLAGCVAAGRATKSSELVSSWKMAVRLILSPSYGGGCQSMVQSRSADTHRGAPGETWQRQSLAPGDLRSSVPKYLIHLGGRGCGCPTAVS